MLKKFWTLIITTVFVCLSPVLVQASSEYDFTSQRLQSSQVFTGVILKYDVTKHINDDVHFEMRFKNGNKMSEWVVVEIDTLQSGRSKGDALINTNPTKEYEYRYKTEKLNGSIQPKIHDVSFEFINPQGDFSNVVASVGQFASLSSSNKRLKVISRSAWGAKDEYNHGSNIDNSDGDKSDIEKDDPEIVERITTENGKNLKWPYEYMDDVRMIVIHHTAGTSDLNDPKQAIRNIQYYHAVTRGWGDIGYNYIIDQQGNIYEGRKGGEKVVGGHALPVNKTSIGISVLGNFETQKVPKDVVNAIIKLSREKADLYGLDVSRSVTYKGRSYPVLGGHRDNSSTACPGKNLYSLMPTIKALIASGLDLDMDERTLSKFDFAYVDPTPLRNSVTLKAQESQTVTIKLKNIGKKTWNRSNTYLTVLNDSSFNKQISVGSTSKLATLEESSVAPGKTGTFKFKATATNTGGATSIVAQGVLNGKRDHSLPIFIPFDVHVSKYQYEIVGETEYNLKMKQGESKNLTVRFRNTGDLDWNDNYKYVRLGVLSPKDFKSKLFGQKNRIADFGTDVIKPRKTYTVKLKIKAPKEDITINEQYAPVIDGLTWFEEGKPLTLNVIVGKGSPVKEDNSNNKNIDLQSEPSSNTVLGPDIRVHISGFKESNANIAVSQNSKITVDGKSVGTLQRNETLSMEQVGQQISVNLDGDNFKGNKVRVEGPVENIFTVLNYNNRPSWDTSLNDNQFRRTAEFIIQDGQLILINELPLEYYMRGVGEVSNSNNLEKIKTIMVAARSYAYYHVTTGKGRKFPGKNYDLNDDPNHTQKYIGYGFEKRSPNVTKALTQTAGKIIVYKGESIVIPYFNNSDGRTRSAQEVWGWTNTPYLLSVDDPYCATPNQLLGHGVGISGCGASGMADHGFAHEDIIQYFLKGVDFKVVYKNTAPTSTTPNTNNPPTPQTTTKFSDVNQATQFAEAISFVQQRGIVEGYANGTYGPLKPINRAEFTKILIEAKFGNIPNSPDTCFKDSIPNEWYSKYLCKAKKEGIIEGYPDGNFRPAQNINIAEALKIVTETFYSTIPNADGEWYTKYVNLAKKEGIYISENWSLLDKELNRAEMAEVIFRIQR